MTNRCLTIASSSGRELSKNMELIHNGLKERYPEVDFDYYIANLTPGMKQLTTKNALGEEISYKDLTVERNRFCKRETPVIISDKSASALPDSRMKDQRCVLIFEPYDYVFKKLYENVPEKHAAFSQCTDIIPYTKYMEEMLQEHYTLKENVHFKKISVPFANSLCNAQEAQEYRSRAEFIFPELKGKKVITVFFSDANYPTDTVSTFINVDMEDVLKQLPQEWSIITNSLLLCKKCSCLPASAADRIIYCQSQLFSQINLLYFTDVLISDASFYVCSFASKGLPFYVTDNANNYFSKYVDSYFPSLILKDLRGLPELVKNITLTDEQEDFKEMFAPSVIQEDYIREYYKLLFE